jgi:hypothetical protein
MTDVYLNLGNSPKDPYPSFNLGIDKDKESHKKQVFLKLEDPQKILSYLLALTHLNLEHIEDEIEMYKTVFVTDSAVQHVRNLRALFRQLTDEDLSQDFSYALKLSKSWNGITSYQDSASIKELKKEAHVKLGKLIDLFYRYPTKDEHALGYYLRQYAGENWLPFPFMKILSDLHEDYMLKKEDSTLGQMIRLLTNIIESF